MEMDLHFAELLEARFRWTKHHVIATLRQDGSPRVSGTEVHIIDGVWWLGSMPGSRKAADMRADERVALHSSPEPAGDELAFGDAKICAHAIDRTGTEDTARFTQALISSGNPPPPGPFDLFRLDITEASIVRVEGTELVITSWKPQSGVRIIRRS
jgi:Pyridoxamine 5'-phosphate oxidase